MAWSQLSFLMLVMMTAMVAADHQKRVMDAGASRSMLADIAKELIARSGTSSQVSIYLRF